jgi:hypothetical protein
LGQIMQVCTIDVGSWLVHLLTTCKVAVDHDGNIFQWGSGYGREQPQLTLQHGDIVQVAAR